MTKRFAEISLSNPTWDCRNCGNVNKAQEKFDTIKHEFEWEIKHSIVIDLCKKCGKHFLDGYVMSVGDGNAL